MEIFVLKFIHNFATIRSTHTFTDNFFPPTTATTKISHDRSCEHSFYKLHMTHIQSTDRPTDTAPPIIRGCLSSSSHSPLDKDVVYWLIFRCHNKTPKGAPGLFRCCDLIAFIRLIYYLFTVNTRN